MKSLYQTNPTKQNLLIRNLLLLHDHKKNKKNPCRERNNFKIRNRKNTNKISYKLQQEQ